MTEKEIIYIDNYNVTEFFYRGSNFCITTCPYYSAEIEPCFSVINSLNSFDLEGKQARISLKEPKYVGSPDFYLSDDQKKELISILRSDNNFYQLIDLTNFTLRHEEKPLLNKSEYQLPNYLELKEE